MQRLEVSGAVRLTSRSLGVKGLSNQVSHFQCSRAVGACDILNKKTNMLLTRPKLPERNRTSDCANRSMPVVRICHNNIHKYVGFTLFIGHEGP